MRLFYEWFPGSADRTVKFWDLETFELIGSSGPEVCLAVVLLRNDELSCDFLDTRFFSCLTYLLYIYCLVRLFSYLSVLLFLIFFALNSESCNLVHAF